MTIFLLNILKNKWTLIILAVVILSVFVLPNLFKNRGKKSHKGTSEDLRELKKKGIEPNYPDSQYKIFADKLFSAMEFANTDEEAIYSVMEKMKNQADIVKTISAYGVRTLHFFGIPQEFNLINALRDELTTSEQENVNEILKKNGVNMTL